MQPFMFTSFQVTGSHDEEKRPEGKTQNGLGLRQNSTSRLNLPARTRWRREEIKKTVIFGMI